MVAGLSIHSARTQPTTEVRRYLIVQHFLGGSILMKVQSIIAIQILRTREIS